MLSMVTGIAVGVTVLLRSYKPSLSVDGQGGNLWCYLWRQASLVAADRLYSVKKEILEGSGFTTPQEFPITVDGMPVQLLSYMRMARIQDSAEFAKVPPAPAPHPPPSPWTPHMNTTH